MDLVGESTTCNASCGQVANRNQIIIPEGHQTLKGVGECTVFVGPDEIRKTGCDVCVAFILLADMEISMIKS